MIEPFREVSIDVVAGQKTRGFIFRAPGAQGLNADCVLLRKPGKLSHQTQSVSCELEYATNALQAHDDAPGHDHRVLLVNNLIATGSTAATNCSSSQRFDDTVVGRTFVIELDALQGRAALAGQTVHTLSHF